MRVCRASPGQFRTSKQVCLWTTGWPLATYKVSVSLFPKRPAGQANFLRNPGNYLFFQYHSGSGLILGIDGDDNFWTVNSRLLAYIKITNFLPNGTAITVRNDEGYEWMMHGSVNQVSTNGTLFSYGEQCFPMGTIRITRATWLLDLNEQQPLVFIY